MSKSVIFMDIVAEKLFHLEHVSLDETQPLDRVRSKTTHNIKRLTALGSCMISTSDERRMQA
jgi:hypothetical protein